MIRVGTRKSNLAVAQAELVASQIEDKLGLETEIVKLTSKGDLDQVSKLTSFRGEGVFTSFLEQALSEGIIDVAVHSLKDLPVEVDEDLPIVAYIQRHSPGDSLLINSSAVLSQDPLELEDGVTIATGSPRRQSQLLDRFPNANIVDIRGNVHTRVSRLETSFIQGLVMATAVFDRIDLPLPSGVERIDLDPVKTPPAPGQASIAVQVRQGEFHQLEILNHVETEQAVLAERQLLARMGGGCELSFAAFIGKISADSWLISTTQAPVGWYPGENLHLSRFYAEAESPQHLVNKYLKVARVSSVDDETHPQLQGKIVGIVRDANDSKDYHTLLSARGAIVINSPIFQYQTNWQLLLDQDLLDAWEKCDWVVISSKRAVPFLDGLNRAHPKSRRYAAVGRRTATSLRKYRFPVHVVAEGNMNDLASQLSNARQIYPGSVLYLHGENYSAYPSDDTHGFAVYKAKITDFDLGVTPDYLVVFSPRSGIKILEHQDVASSILVAIGPKTKEVLDAEHDYVLQAATPSPQGVLQTILEDLS